MRTDRPDLKYNDDEEINIVTDYRLLCTKQLNDITDIDPELPILPTKRIDSNQDSFGVSLEDLDS